VGFVCPSKKGSVKRINISLSEELLRRLDELVASGRYVSRSEAIRRAIELLLQKEGERELTPQPAEESETKN